MHVLCLPRKMPQASGFRFYIINHASNSYNVYAGLFLQRVYSQLEEVNDISP